MPASPPATQDELVCANYALCSWQVRGGEQLTIEIAGDGDVLPTPARWPARTVHGRATVHEVRDGWLLGFDHGEWGASVWWWSKDGSTATEISDVAVVEFFSFGDEVLAPAGSDLHRGVVARFVNSPDGTWTRGRSVALLNFTPTAATRDGNTILVASVEGVTRVNPEGQQEVVARRDWSPHGYARTPNSIVKGDDGTILLGMPHGIARLQREQGGSYTEDWLLPPPCLVSYVPKDRPTCVCAGLAGVDGSLTR